MYKYYCEKCKKEFETRKKEQRYCSKSCANSANTIKRKIEAKNDIEKFYEYLYKDATLFLERKKNLFI